LLGEMLGKKIPQRGHTRVLPSGCRIEFAQGRGIGQESIDRRHAPAPSLTQQAEASMHRPSRLYQGEAFDIKGIQEWRAFMVTALNDSASQHDLCSSRHRVTYQLRFKG
jgi:hypothetical protein